MANQRALAVKKTHAKEIARDPTKYDDPNPAEIHAKEGTGDSTK